MLLALDIGNSHTVVGCLEGLEIIRSWRISTRPLITQDELRLKLTSFFSEAQFSASQFRGAVISSVVPTFTPILVQALKGLGIASRVITHEGPFGFQIKAHPAEQVGADRLVNAQAAISLYGAPCLIVDSGTATTLCAIGPEREYLGGAIVPGLELSMQALAQNTAKLFLVDLTPPASPIGTNTRDALRSGLILGYAEMLDGLIRRFKKELRVDTLPVVATGGVSLFLSGIMKEITHHDPDLTLKGLASLQRIYEDGSISR